MNIKNNNILQFNKKFKKLKKNIVLKNFKLLLLNKYDVVVFANFNFYNFLNISIFKDIVEKNNIKYLYLKTNDYKFLLKNNIILKFWNDLTFIKKNNLNLELLKLFLVKKKIILKNNIINFLNYFNSSFNKNFNIILFLDQKNINNNVLETLKLYAKVDPLYLHFKSHKKLISYDYLVNNILNKKKNLNNLNICTFSLYHQIQILKIINLKYKA